MGKRRGNINRILTYEIQIIKYSKQKNNYGDSGERLAAGVVCFYESP